MRCAGRLICLTAKRGVLPHRHEFVNWQMIIKIRGKDWKLISCSSHWTIGRVGSTDDQAYFTSIEGVAKYLLEMGLRQADAASLLELVHIAKAVRDDVRELRWFDE